MKANPIFKSKSLLLLSSKSQKTELSQKPPPPLMKEKEGKGKTTELVGLLSDPTFSTRLILTTSHPRDIHIFMNLMIRIMDGFGLTISDNIQVALR
ncbi:hypothetical protein VNO78_08762 [Psophocarpus tetragonolobus]|uniref:Uncharacterized protein n=1 Tax=Psophocarpus tetragonolobus TaxID=3891 RepID=A0AAN9T603_PSOTE